MELNFGVYFFFVALLMWLWTLSDKLSSIIDLLEIIAQPYIKEDIMSLADDIFAAEYEKYHLEAARRAK